MQEYIKERCQTIGTYIVETGSTVRQAAARFGVSKSSVHKDMVERLPVVNAELSHEVRGVLEINKSERHIRGGQATLLKYRKQSGQRNIAV